MHGGWILPVKSGRVSVDAPPMPELPLWVWCAFAFVAAAGSLSLLRVLAIQVRNDTTLHNLRVRVYDVRIDYIKRIIAAYEPASDAHSENDLTYTADEVHEQARAA
ncbi:MAG: hypothetical protein Kow0022_06320 [Phycisphaerales bacterium]